MNKCRTARARASLAVAALPLAFLATGARGQGFMSEAMIPPGQERFEIELGGIVNRFDSHVRLDGQNGRGSDINLENNDLDKNLSSFVGAFTWRFLPNHRLDAMYYGAKRSGSRTYQTDIDIGDQDFPVGATVSLKSKTEIFDVNYRWSFWRTPELEAAALFGLYGGTFKYDFNAVGTEGTNPRTYNKSVSTTVPLPVLGASIDWYPDPRWKVSAAAAGIKASIGDVDGHALVASLSGEYMFWRSLGLGARYTYTDIKADVTKSDFNGTLGVKLNGVMLYAKMVF